MPGVLLVFIIVGNSSGKLILPTQWLVASAVAVQRWIGKRKVGILVLDFVKFWASGTDRLPL